jgi:3-methyladenine DNA glycosylase AlkD
MVSKYAAGDDPMKKDVFDMYLRNTRYINNWDLVDLSSHHIVGDFLLDKPRQILYDMAGSSLIWDRRIAIVSTARFIKNGYFDDTLKISALLLGDREDLIHKAADGCFAKWGRRTYPYSRGSSRSII